MPATPRRLPALPAKHRDSERPDGRFIFTVRSGPLRPLPTFRPHGSIGRMFDVTNESIGTIFGTG